jgi:exopolysaccharide biosynthesis polyprenyl glycosylphosphotransferase
LVRLAVCLPVLYLVLGGSRLRLRRRLATTVGQELRDAVLPLAAGTLVCLSGWEVVRRLTTLSSPPQDALLSVCAFGVTAVALSRRLSLSLRGGRRRKVVVVGSGVVAGRVSAHLAAGGAVEVVGFVDDDPKEPTGWLGPLSALAAVCDERAVDHVVVAFSRADAEDLVEALRPLQGRIPISVVPRLFDVTPAHAHAHDLVAGYPALSVVPFAGGGWERAAKRALDVVGGTLGLLLALPVLLVSTVGVRLSSRGPVLLRQVRVGRGGKPFTIWKFRTFTVTESVPPPEVLASGELVTGPFPKLKDDPRATAFGRLLRRTSMDELPQLLNVVLGTMSLVGPRPLAPDFAWSFSRWGLRRYDVKPGLTGLWQVSGRNDLTYEEMCRLDTLYSTSWSIGLDLRILARTARAVISGRGCY